MSKKEFIRIRKKNGFATLLKNLILKSLNSFSSNLIKDRKYKMAVFANDWIGANIFTYGVYEREIIKDLFFFLNQLGFKMQNYDALDIGANIGNHSIEFSKFFNNVFSFEPNQDTFEILKFNTKNFSNIKIFNFGISDEEKQIDLYEDPTNFGGSSFKNFSPNTNKLQVELKILDNISLPHNIGFIKIDVEGMELNVLRGGRKLLEKNRPIICFEQNYEDFKNNLNETESIQYLRDLGYKLYILETNRKKNSFLRKAFNLIKDLISIKELRKIKLSEKIQKGTYDLIFAVPKDESID